MPGGLENLRHDQQGDDLRCTGQEESDGFEPLLEYRRAGCLHLPSPRTYAGAQARRPSLDYLSKIVAGQ